MSTATAIGDVTETLQDLLTNGQKPAGLFTVSLKSPAEEAADVTTNHIVNLFLVRVLENPFSKNRPWEPVDGSTLVYPPLALNLLYMITPFATDRLDEHRILGHAMVILHDNPIVAGANLRGGLANTGEELKVDLLPFNVDELTKIWNAMSKPYRLSVCYEVRIVLLDSTVERHVSRVVESIQIFSTK